MAKQRQWLEAPRCQQSFKTDRVHNPRCRKRVEDERHFLQRPIFQELGD
jgi:hypothetical protein